MNHAAVRFDTISSRALDRLLDKLRHEGIRDERVLEAMQRVPRHHFVEEGLQLRAYDDIALPIGFQQTISQPYVVARMLELLLAGREPGRTLEVGVGCGYQTALLAQLAPEVYGIERIRALFDLARENLRPFRFAHVRLKHGDGMLGLPEVAPFDSIIVAAAAPVVPPALVEQLSLGGRLVMPVGDAVQSLRVVDRTSSGIVLSEHEPVRFVPLLGGVG
jgi:protein-L-isoaspartate(D-aspartate) O-methyltransferase